MGDSLTYLPFGVTSAEVVIICPETWRWMEDDLLCRGDGFQIPYLFSGEGKNPIPSRSVATYLCILT